MIVNQKKIRYLIILIVGLYVLLYIAIAKFKFIGIENVNSLISVCIVVYVLGIVLSYIFFKKKLPFQWIAYEIIGFALISFFIMSVFVLKIEDIYYWDIEKERHKTFFKFSFEILGWNYILAIPYLILLITECGFLLSSSKRNHNT